MAYFNKIDLLLLNDDQTKFLVCEKNDIANDEEMLLPFNNEPFVCIIWNGRENFVSYSLIEKILNANCKYFIAGGIDCEKWHDCADDIYVSSYPDFNPPILGHVMTTWHENQSLEEVIWYALNLTSYNGNDFKNFLFIQIDTKLSKKDILKIITNVLE